MIYKKSVVLSSINRTKEKAVVSLECDSGEIVGNVRLYNFSKEPDGILSVGILCDKKVLKAGLTRESEGFYTFKLNGEKNLNTFSCALVNLVGGEAKPLLMGSSNGTSLTEEKLCNSLSVFDEKPTIDAVTEVLDANGIFWDNVEEVEETIDGEFFEASCGNKCSECKYRDAFYKLGDDISMPEEKEETFFDGVKEQIDELFNKYPEEEILKQLIPESKWVKIDYEEKNEYYVVGLLYENNKIKYVCYGVPSVSMCEPPEELRGFSQWLPIDVSKEKGFGYWIAYQDAITGENVKISFDII